MRARIALKSGVLLALSAAVGWGQAPPTPPPPAPAPAPAPPPPPAAPAPPDKPGDQDVAPPAVQVGPAVPLAPSSGPPERQPFVRELFREERDGSVTVFFRVGHEKGKVLIPFLQKFLTPKGEMLENEPLHTLMVRDVKENIDRVVAILKLLDTPEPQVLIQATIWEMSDDVNLQIGVEGISRPAASLDPIDLPIPEAAVLVRPAEMLSESFFRQVSARFQPSEFIRSIQPNATPFQGAGVAFGSVSGRGTFSALMRLLASKGYAKLLAEPRIMVQSGKPAEFFAGEFTPYGKSNLVGNPPIINSTVDWLPTGVTLKIQAHIMGPDVVEVDLKPSVKTVIGTTITPAGPTPAYIERRADTIVSVPSEAEIVIGGLRRSETIFQESGIPFLMDIPLLGLLFKRHEDKTTQTDICFVIKPTIITDVQKAPSLVPPKIEPPPAPAR